MTVNRIKHTIRLPPDLSAQLAEFSIRKRVPQAHIVEAALASFFSPDGSDRIEAAVSRRLDRLSRQADRLAYHIEVSNEALALFVRFWLTSTPPLPDTARAAAKATGKDRYEGFLDALSRRMELGPKLSAELSKDVPGQISTQAED
ncbi:CopG family transcriptional regulator [Altererythrobacter sp. N1]|nr:CopG family transcriptional regulator [Altererythrobacter sp. N1]